MQLKPSTIHRRGTPRPDAVLRLHRRYFGIGERGRTRKTPRATLHTPEGMWSKNQSSQVCLREREDKIPRIQGFRNGYAATTSESGGYQELPQTSHYQAITTVLRDDKFLQEIYSRDSQGASNTQ